MTAPNLTRRSLILGTGALLAANPIDTIESRHGGRLGVYALDTGTGRTLTHRADERFLLCSTFKGPLAAYILSRIDAGQESLSRRIPYTREDLLHASPITTAHLQAGAMTIGDLCAAILAVSDNTAANLLLAQSGGPQALTAYARHQNDTTTRFDRTEPNANDRIGTLDTTTPRAIAQLAIKTVLGDALTPASRLKLQTWMLACTVGRQRLRATLPTTWRIADRTGTGDGQANDYAIAWPPNRPPIVIAAYYDAPGMQTAPQEAVLRDVGAAIAAWA